MPRMSMLWAVPRPSARQRPSGGARPVPCARLRPATASRYWPPPRPGVSAASSPSATPSTGRPLASTRAPRCCGSRGHSPCCPHGPRTRRSSGCAAVLVSTAAPPAWACTGPVWAPTSCPRRGPTCRSSVSGDPVKILSTLVGGGTPWIRPSQDELWVAAGSAFTIAEFVEGRAFGELGSGRPRRPASGTMSLTGSRHSRGSRGRGCTASR